MTNEQREAIEYLKESVLIYKNTIHKISDAIETALSLIKEQEKKIENLQKEVNEENKRCMILANNDKFKEQMIDLMTEWISERCFYKDDYSNSCEIIQDSCSKEDDCKDCIKQYFERKVEDVKD